VVGRPPDLAQPAPEDRGRGQEGQGERDPERLEGEGAEVDLGLHQS
jgi:hypothetical protein